MAKLIVNRDDLHSGARNKPSGDVSINDLNRRLMSAIQYVDQVIFDGDDDGKTPVVLKGSDEHGREQDQPDYLDRREPVEGEESREGVEGGELQHHDTTGAGAPGANEDGPSRSDGIVGGGGTSSELSDANEGRSGTESDGSQDDNQRQNSGDLSIGDISGASGNGGQSDQQAGGAEAGEGGEAEEEEDQSES